MRFIATTPLYYVNAAPHMGSAYPTLAVDALTRYYRLQGAEVSMITGGDEHGEKIATTAEKRGLQPQQHCDELVAEFEQLWQALHIHYDRFIRTTDSRHAQIVKEFFARVWAKGDIYKAAYSGLYCIDCEEFKDPKDLVGDNLCAIHGKPVVLRQEENYFFALSKYQQALETYFAEHPDFVQPATRCNEVLGWVKDGLRDFSISRAHVQWGIPLPIDPAQTVYVWFDALLGYMTALLEPEDEATLAHVLARGWPADVHVIGKDILRFHAVYWPAMLLSADLPLPKKVFGHGFLTTKDGRKMGKSTGNVLNPYALLERYGLDAVRYYFLRGIEFGKDGDFSEERFVQTVNADLANDLGNLLNRTLGLLTKNCDNIIPEQAIATDHPLRVFTMTQVATVARAYEDLDFAGACEGTIAIAQLGNRYFNDQAPWSLFKKGERAEAEVVLYSVLELVRLCAILLAPVTPDLSERIYQQLGFAPASYQQLMWQDTAWGGLPAGQTPRPAEPVFLRLEEPS